jgi:hypothetical protein
MKIFLTITLAFTGLLTFFQIYNIMAKNKTETQGYSVIKEEKLFEIRFYPAANLAKITSTSKSYRDLGYSGFGKLAKYIFGGNIENKKIAMTSPVHMDIGDSISSMAFVMPAHLTINDLPKPNNSDITLETTEAEYVAAIKFGGFANTASINKQKEILKKALDQKGLSYFGNFRYLGYNPPYQIFGRRNEIIVSLNPANFSTEKNATNSENLEGYPHYPDSEDIYSQQKEEKDIDPEDITKKKAPNEKEGGRNEKSFKNHMSGDDLDIPGGDLDDQEEQAGNEDEENNFYSLGGDNHNDLDEDKA